MNTSSVQAHLDHGDIEGPCGPCNTSSMQTLPDEIIKADGHSPYVVDMNHSEANDMDMQITELNQISIHPNPVSDLIDVVLPNKLKSVTLRILTITGQEIHALHLRGQQSMMIDDI